MEHIRPKSENNHRAHHHLHDPALAKSVAC